MDATRLSTSCCATERAGDSENCTEYARRPVESYAATAESAVHKWKTASSGPNAKNDFLPKGMGSTTVPNSSLVVTSISSAGNVSNGAPNDEPSSATR